MIFTRVYKDGGKIALVVLYSQDQTLSVKDISSTRIGLLSSRNCEEELDTARPD